MKNMLKLFIATLRWQIKFNKLRGGFFVGDRVVINDQCLEPYIGATGEITEHKRYLQGDSLIFCVEFDDPIGTLKEEWFSPLELDKLV